MNSLAARLGDNLARVRDRVARAAESSGREPASVTLVGVTKYVEAETAAALVACGCLDLGESRPQELWSKATELAALPVRWHLIGHLQRNKIRRTLPLVELIHSVDSRRLLAALEEEASAANCTVRVLLEVNITPDMAKTGLRPKEAEGVLAWAAALKHVTIGGIMGMASLEGGTETARRDFARLRQLRDQLSACCPPNVALDELSMGMSNDFEIAIEEGSTMVRVGSALFEGIDL
ncbi:MAG TPA: YggS family pyridoxal phosphate-dependent enzyme [Pirellulales bacterium]|jgi:pyridoxal phosphate enzyme (YggS family)|nr:YggS family pyridoxal phosphate-dependent enzyme [Pirellulales bacterium]